MEFFEDKYQNLKNLADGHLTNSIGVEKELEKIKKILTGSTLRHSFAPSDWCIIDVRDEETTVQNGFNEFEPVKIKTNDFFYLLNKWATFLKSMENNKPYRLENINYFNGSERIESRKTIFFSSLKHFDGILGKYNMVKEIDSSYEYGASIFYNEKCKINIAFDRYCENLELDFTDIQSKKTYNYSLVYKALGLENKIKELPKNDSEKSQLEEKIESFGLTIEKYCFDILNGDFSELNG